MGRETDRSTIKKRESGVSGPKAEMAPHQQLTPFHRLVFVIHLISGFGGMQQLVAIPPTQLVAEEYLHLHRLHLHYKYRVVMTYTPRYLESMIPSSAIWISMSLLKGPDPQLQETASKSASTSSTWTRLHLTWLCCSASVTGNTFKIRRAVGLTSGLYRYSSMPRNLSSYPWPISAINIL